MEYAVVTLLNPATGGGPEFFNTQIQNLLVSGYVPLGGIALQSNGYLAQAFTRGSAPGPLLPVVDIAVDSSVTEVSGTTFSVDTSVAIINITLPATPVVGQYYTFVANSLLNFVNVIGNGRNVQGTPTYSSQSFSIVYVGPTGWWIF